MQVMICGKRTDIRGILIEKDLLEHNITDLFIMPKRLEVGTIVFDEYLEKSWAITDIVILND